MKIFKNSINTTQLVSAFLPPILWAAVIFVFSSQTSLPGFEQSAYDFVLKKVAHIFVYLILYLLVVRSVTLTIKKGHKNLLMLLPIFICLFYATSDEFHQSLVPGRYSTLRDIGYDMLGVSIAFLKKFGYI